MSIPAPHFKQLYEAIFVSISYHEKTLREMSQNASEDEKALIYQFQSVLSELETKLDTHTDFSSRDIQQISFDVHKKINKIFKSFVYQITPLEEHERHLFLLNSLKQELKILKHTLSHQREIEERGLESFLDTSWGWKLFEQMAKVGNLWALQTLRHFIVSDHPKAFPFLIRNHLFISLNPLICEFKDHPKIRENLERMLKKNEEEVRHAYGFIFIVLETENWQWGQALLKRQLEKDPIARDIFKQVFDDQSDPNSFINQYALEQFSQDLPLGIDCLANTLSHPNPKASILMIPVIEMAFDKKNVYFDMLLLALTALSDQENGLFKKVSKIIERLEKERGKIPGSYYRILIDLIQKKAEVLQCLKNVGEDHVYAGKIRADFVIVRIFQMFSLRKLELIEWLEKGRALSPVTAAPISDDFPTTPAIMIGWSDDYQYFAKVISNTLALHQVTTYSLISEDERSESEQRNLAYLSADFKIQIWLQDACFVCRKIDGNNLFQYPYWTSVDDGGLSDFVRQRMNSRFSKDYDDLKLEDHSFATMGKVNDQQAQLYLFGSILKTDPQMKNQRFQFTFNEGGNCLIGQKGGKSYAIIGKDARDFNRLWLTKELSTLGFKKNELNQWQLSEPYNEEELTLTDEDLKFFFAKDLGIDDPNLIYFIEQANYHLDMVMTVIGEKKVMLNDSLLAYQKMEEQYQQKKRDLKGLTAEKILIEKRLSMSLKKAKKMKLLEDAAASDLIDQGFEVIRFAGIFQDIFKSHPENHQTNLFNFLSLTTPQGQKLIISLGCDPQYQIHFKEMLDKHCKIEWLYFLDKNQSEALLSKAGGIRCMTKRCAATITSKD